METKTMQERIDELKSLSVSINVQYYALLDYATKVLNAHDNGENMRESTEALRRFIARNEDIYIGKK